MLDPCRASKLLVLLGAALVVATSALGACSTPAGVTPDCVFNVTAGGIQAMPDGCERFAYCLNDEGKILSDAKACCVDEEGQSLEGDSLVACLYGFGAGPPPSSSSSSSSSGGGAGGAGGAGGGT